jgi:dihydroorotate dehydrogenase (fumarate)
VPDTDISLDDLQLCTRWRMSPPGSITENLASIMRVHAYCPAMSLAASGGISSSSDVIKVLLAGADVAMVTSAIYREGPNVIRNYLDGLRVFLQRHQVPSVRELRQRRPIPFSDEQQRRDYRNALSSRLSGEDVQASAPTMTGDRFGHPV